MEKLFLIPQQGAVFLTLLGVGIGLGAWWQLLSWVRRRMPGLGALWDGLFAVSLGASLLGVLLRWREEQLRLAEGYLAQAMEVARQGGIQREELHRMLDLLYEEEE